MSTSHSKCYVNRTGFADDTAYVEVFADGHSIVHTKNGQQNAIAHAFERPIESGEWVEIGDPTAHSPAGLDATDSTGVITGNADIAINHPDAVGATQEQSNG